MNNLKKNKIKKYDIYSLIFYTCLFLIFTNIPFSLFINEPIINTLLQALSRILFFIFAYVLNRKEQFISLPKSKVNLNTLLFLPFIIACFSNLIIVSFSKFISFNFNMPSFFIDCIFFLSVSLSEEFIFRFIFYNFFIKHFTRLKSIIFSAVLFGLIHLLNLLNFTNPVEVLIQVAYCTGLGLILGLIYSFTNSLIFTISYHFIFNILNTTFYGFINYKNDVTIYYIINIAIAILLFIYGIILYIKLIKGEENNAT